MDKHTIKNRNTHQSDYDLYDDVEKIKAALADVTRDVKGRAGEVFYHSVDDLKEKTTQIQTDVGQYVAEKPLKSLGIALLTGIVIGYFIHK